MHFYLLIFLCCHCPLLTVVVSHYCCIVCHHCFLLFPGGSLIVSTGTNYYGNNVTLRDSFLSSGAFKSWFDFETKLPAGTLKRCFFFVHPTPGISDTSTFIRLQIWRPVDATEYRYMLVWEKRVQVDLTSQNGLFYTVSDLDIAKC